MTIISMNFLITTILLVLNIAFLILKSKDTALIAWVCSFFTWIMCIYYIIDLEGVLGIELLYVIMVIFIALISFIRNGMEK